MLACVDVDYRPDDSATAACLLFEDWATAVIKAAHLAKVERVEAYRPGQFYRRELPCILQVLAQASGAPDVVLVDAYVTLDALGSPGLGARLHEALAGKVAVVGIAKTRYAAATTAIPVLRGASRTPLWVTAIGIDSMVAADRVRAMHGGHRVPTMLRMVDRLARGVIGSVSLPG